MWESISLTVAATAGNNIGKVLQKKDTLILPPLSFKLKAGSVENLKRKERYHGLHEFSQVVTLKDRVPVVNLATAFEKEGISAFRFDFAGNGESEGSYQYGNYRRQANDLHSIVEHFLQKKRVISAIVGHSKASGASASKERAQDQVSFEIITTVGATVFNLTLMWGICVVFSTKDVSEKTSFQPAESSPFKNFKRLTDAGVTLDPKTSYTTRIMLLSLIAFALVQPVSAFNSLFGRRLPIFITLVLSLILLLSYFIYQIFDPWMQERS